MSVNLGRVRDLGANPGDGDFQMAKIGRNLTELAKEIERRADAKKDYIAPVTKLSMEVDRDNGTPTSKLAVMNGARQLFAVNEIAHPQIAQYTGIALPYYRRMVSDDPQLLATNVNRWLHNVPTDRRMVRTLDGSARAFLSDRYRALENEDLAEAVLPVLLDADLLIVSCEITERRLYIKAVDRRIERDIPTGRAMGDGSHTFFDTCSPAISISNSEVGHGALSIETGVYTKVCTNLAMIGSNLRKYHSGSRATVTNEVYALLTDDTRRATDRAVWMQVRDLVKGAFDQARFDATLGKLKDATKNAIPADQAVEVIERAGRHFSLSEGERKGILGRLIESSDLTRYGLHAAITRYSQDAIVTYDRASELERIGGDVIELPSNDWRALVAA
jgi:hypothetical protein